MGVKEMGIGRDENAGDGMRVAVEAAGAGKVCRTKSDRIREKWRIGGYK
jgi:hypothetical protein